MKKIGFGFEGVSMMKLRRTVSLEAKSMCAPFAPLSRKFAEERGEAGSFPVYFSRGFDSLLQWAKKPSG